MGAPAFTRRRQFRRRPYRTLAIVLLMAILAAVRAYTTRDQVDVHQPLAEGEYRVVRVVDGDTLIVAPDVRIRLIGVDAPETVKPDTPVQPFGPEASEFTREFVSGGHVRLTFDRERIDRFGRHLAYVWVGDRLLNEQLARNGLARYEPVFHYSPAMKSPFPRSARRGEARAARHLVGGSGGVLRQILCSDRRRSVMIVVCGSSMTLTGP